MKKYLVVYFSKSGNNRYLAENISKNLNCDLEQLKPRVGGLFFMMMSILTKISLGNRSLKHDPAEYEQIILCGPIWVGSVIPPLKDFILKYRQRLNRVYFVTCCGSKDESKNDKFGYATIVPKVETLLGYSPAGFEAFPIGLILDHDKKDDDNAMMKARLSDETFTGDIKERLDNFLYRLS